MVNTYSSWGKQLLKQKGKNNMEQKKHYIIYQTTNLVNGKIYIGQHQTYDVNDEYLGSGKILQQAIEKYGRENFKREILFDFDNFTDMDNKEKELVTEEFVKREDTYNVRVGGQNPDIVIFGFNGGKRVAQLQKEDPEFAKWFRQRLSDAVNRSVKKRRELGLSLGKGKKHSHPKNRKKSSFGFLGKKHSEESKAKIREQALLRKVKGQLPFAVNTVWIYNETTLKNLRIKKDQLEKYISEGWKVGRKMGYYHNGK